GSILCTTCTVDSSSSGTGENAGRILLAAFSGSGGGNISVSTINAGTLSVTGGKSGSVTVFAPGTINLNNIRMDRALVPGTFSSPLLVTPAQPTGSITANAVGLVTGSLAPSSTLAAGGIINLNGNINNASGVVTCKAGSAINMADNKTIDLNATVLGKGGGNLTFISNNTILLAGEIAANGTGGVAGTPGGSPGVAGTAGGTGGRGGTITFTATGNITTSGVDAISISGTGGTGGVGGAGGAGTGGSPSGGAGGAGGVG